MSLTLIEKRLDELVPNRDEPLYCAARYSLLAPGKRLRPQLVLAAAESLGADIKLALDPACAVEMIHTYSLIHDDLPCMDDDDLRRGRPTLHKVFGEGMALLAGDYLLTYAFEVLANAPGLTAQQKIGLVLTLAQKGGSDGMIGGQAIDISSQGKEIDQATLEKMHIGKTAALFTACLEFGAVIANADSATREHLKLMGQDAGLAYQILDDILDETATAAELGKRPGTDAAKNKPTAVSLYGLEGAASQLEALTSSLFERADFFSPPLNELFRKLFQKMHSSVK
ncbi:MAG: polyprenyl synthetase family protein [Verrucomicrobia bacterium]|nr:polyprenyl synthetase family protein [Verrucomicrobiota bacterium]